MSTRDVLVALAGKLSCEGMSDECNTISQVVRSIDKTIKSEPALDKTLSWTSSALYRGVSNEPESLDGYRNKLNGNFDNKAGVVFDIIRNGVVFEVLFLKCSGPPDMTGSRFHFKDVNTSEEFISDISCVDIRQRARLVKVAIDSFHGGKFVWSNDGEPVSGGTTK